MSKDSHSVLLIEDNLEVRKRLQHTIDNEPDFKVCAAVGSLDAANTFLNNSLPSVALIDLGLPDGNGVTIINWLSVHAPHVETLVLTVFSDENSVVSAIEAGASGYLLKSETAENITSNLRMILRGESPISPSVARYILKSFRHVNSRQTKNTSKAQGTAKNITQLTPAEYEIINLIAKGYTAPEIAKMTNRSVQTVPVHVKNIYKKLSVNSRGEAIYEATQQGLLDVHGTE